MLINQVAKRVYNTMFFGLGNNVTKDFHKWTDNNPECYIIGVETNYCVNQGENCIVISVWYNFDKD